MPSRERQVKMMEAIHDEAVDAIVTIDQDGIVQTVNPATSAMFGYAAEELEGQNVSMLMPAPFRQEHDYYMKKYLETGRAKIIGIGREVTGLKEDGTTFPIHLAVSEIVVSGARLFVGVIHDLTELKNLEAEETTLGRIIEESLNEVYIFDVDTFEFIMANRGGRENLGYTLEEMQQLTPLDIKPNVTRTKFLELIKPLVEGEKSKVEFVTQHRRKDGSLYDVHVDLQKAMYKNRPAFVAIILDITQRLQAERALLEQQESMRQKLAELVERRTEELREAQAELVRAEKFSTLGKVSGGIAHEIRNPLNAVKTSAYYLLNAKQPTEEKIREHLERIDRQVNMIDSVVTALSDVARLPAARLTPVDLKPIVQTAVNSINMPSTITISYEWPDDLPKVMVDENQIIIAIKNLVRNARDAMPEGGQLSIRAVRDNDRLHVFFEDTGIGISPDHLEKILEPLFTTKARGMGLGLSITHAIAEKNNCELTIDSAVGKGSTFAIGLTVDDGRDTVEEGKAG